MTRHWEKSFDFGGKEYVVQFVQRPFREGLEARLKLENGKEIRISELGLGEIALFEKIKNEIKALEAKKE